MQLIRVRVANLGPFANLVFHFADADDRPRPFTCVLGSAGTGKSSLLMALAATRPGYAVALSSGPMARASNAPWALCDWSMGDDEIARPHPLRVATPGLLLERESEEQATVRRREQTLYERRAAEKGFAFVAIPGCRWFSRSPVVLSSPDRSLLRHDPRTAPSFEDATRSDLARETKQVLSYSAIAAALESKTQTTPMRRFHQALEAAVNELLSLVGFSFVGADSVTLEPLFTDSSGTPVPFSELPTGVRHLTSFIAVAVRAIAAAYPDRDPREGQAVVVIDDVDLHLDAATQRALAQSLRKALPRVQWIVTTCSPTVALGCEPDEILALRRTDTHGAIELYTGQLAIMH